MSSYGTDADDVINGSEASESLGGNGGNDVIHGAGGGDTINGNAGNDQLHGDDGDDYLYGDAGDDLLYGGTGKDRLTAGPGSDTLDGGAGDDWLVVGGGGTKTVIGGAGIDTLSFEGATAGVVYHTDINDLQNTYGDEFDVATGVERIFGSNFNDQLIGGDGADDLSGGLGTDILTGGAGDDTLNSGYDIVISSRPSPTYGDTGFNQLFGGDGADTLHGGATDLLDGGAGDDIITAVSPAGPIWGSTTQHGSVSIVGGTGDDTILVQGNDAIIDAGSGTDVITLGYNDHIFTVYGNAQITTGAGADIINFAAGRADILDFTLTGAEQDVMRFSENPFATLLLGQDGADAVLYERYGSGVSIRLRGVDAQQLNASHFVSNTGEGYTPPVEIWKVGTTGADLLTGTAGADRIDGMDGADVIIGGAGDDVLRGGRANDRLLPGDGNDTVDGIYGQADFYWGGFDVVDYSDASGGIQVDMRLSSAQVTGASGVDNLISIDAVVGSNFGDTMRGDDTVAYELFGGGGADTLTAGAIGTKLDGGAGDDTLLGGAGEDKLVGGLGGDQLTGGGGGDTFLVGAGDSVAGGADSIADFATGVDLLDISAVGATKVAVVSYGTSALVFGSGADDQSVLQIGVNGAFQVSDIQTGSSTFGFDIIGQAAINTLAGGLGADRIYGAAGDDLLSGFLGDDQLFGGAGSDRLRGEGGADALFGGAGNDILSGGSSGDLLDGGAGYDYASYATATTGVTVFMGGSYLNTGEAVGDSYVSIEGVMGSAFADLIGGTNEGDALRGEDGNDWLLGGDGGDFLVGGAGNDVMEGGLNRDVMDGQSGDDVASYRQATEGVTVWFTNSGMNQGEAYGDQIVNIENLWGSDFADTLKGDDNGGQVYGFAGADTLDGLGGDDSMNGGAGADTLTGGAGADTFFFLQPSEGGDTITDFVSGQDRLFFSEYWFGQPIAPAGTIDPSRFFSGAAPVATGAQASFLFNTTTHELFYDQDGSGATAAVLMATFSNGVNLAAGDLWAA
jgi:Ca2+-binding RTX toxin-like protein